MLRNVKDLRGLALLATDGVIGKVDDLYFDDEDWGIRYFVDHERRLGRRLAAARLDHLGEPAHQSDPRPNAPPAQPDWGAAWGAFPAVRAARSRLALPRRAGPTRGVARRP